MPFAIEYLRKSYARHPATENAHATLCLVIESPSHCRGEPMKTIRFNLRYRSESIKKQRLKFFSLHIACSEENFNRCWLQ
jgi:hypothetical protein